MTPAQKAMQAALAEFGGSATAMARALGGPVKRQNVQHWAGSSSGAPVEYCSAIERATKGAITRRDLRPTDWHKVWPELVTDEFPAPSTEQTA